MDDPGRTEREPRRMRWVVDRFEEGYAVVDADGVRLDVPRWLLPAGAGEGDRVVAEVRTAPDGATVCETRLDRAAGERGRNEAARLMERLRRAGQRRA